MLTRTRRKTARFMYPFQLAGFDEPHPPGEYDIEEDEHMIEGISWVAYRRVATFIHIPAKNSAASKRQVVEIDHEDLEAALQRDRESAVANDNQ